MVAVVVLKNKNDQYKNYGEGITAGGITSMEAAAALKNMMKGN